MTSHGPAVFVHGNPETSAVWGPLLGELGRDWLIARLEAFRHPIDLVGHD